MTFYSMLSQLAGAVTNIVLDPILIFGLLGMPKMGVTGAAVATVVGQCVGAVLGVWFNLKCNHELQLSIKGFRPNAKIIGKIYQVGVPSIIMQAIGSVMTYGMNRILITFTDTATAVFGVYFKLQSLIFMPVFGMNNGLVPILAYNYGAGSRERFVDSLKCGIKYAVAIMFAGLVIFQAAPEFLLGLFDASEAMLEIGVPALRTISYGFVLAGFGIVCGTAFQALGSATYSMMVSIARQLVVLLPAAYLLSLTGRVQNVWWSFPIAELVSMLITVLFLVKIYKGVIRHIGEE